MDRDVSSTNFLEKCWKLLGLPPPAKVGQTWHVEYAVWPKGNTADVHRWYVLLELLHDDPKYKGSYWRIFNITTGEVEGCHMDFHNGTKQLPYYRLVET